VVHRENGVVLRSRVAALPLAARDLHDHEWSHRSEATGGPAGRSGACTHRGSTARLPGIPGRARPAGRGPRRWSPAGWKSSPDEQRPSDEAYYTGAAAAADPADAGTDDDHSGTDHDHGRTVVHNQGDDYHGGADDHTQADDRAQGDDHEGIGNDIGACRATNSWLACRQAVHDEEAWANSWLASRRAVLDAAQHGRTRCRGLLHRAAAQHGGARPGGVLHRGLHHATCEPLRCRLLPIGHLGHLPITHQLACRSQVEELLGRRGDGGRGLPSVVRRLHRGFDAMLMMIVVLHVLG